MDMILVHCNVQSFETAKNTFPRILLIVNNGDVIPEPLKEKSTEVTFIRNASNLF